MGQREGGDVPADVEVVVGALVKHWDVHVATPADVVGKKNIKEGRMMI